jgi:general secretion pathway protein B
MSYILDALKKLEHEKTKKNRENGVINISGVLFENERPKPDGMAGWKITSIVIVAMLVTFAVTWQFFKSGKVRGNVSQKLAAQMPPATPVRVEPVPVPAVTEPVPQTVPVHKITPKVQTMQRPVTPSSTQPNNLQVPQQKVAPAEDAASILTQQELSKRLRDRKGKTLSAAPLIPAPADIKLSGIAYQDDRHARRAVVNGFLMQEGGIVSGAVITEIYQERVRFSSSGGSFELSLTSSGESAPVK